MLQTGLLTTLLIGCCTVADAKDWPMLYGSPYRNNVSTATNLPHEFQVESQRSSETNIKWKASLGSTSFGNIVVSDGQLYIGTNNGNGYIRRFPNHIDLGCLLCFRESDGEFLWHYSARKLPTGRVHDWPWQGICSSPFIDGERMWFVSNRGEVVCLDTKGFYDDEDDGIPSAAIQPTRVFVAYNDLRPSQTSGRKSSNSIRDATLDTIVRAHAEQQFEDMASVTKLAENIYLVKHGTPDHPVGISENSTRRVYHISFTDDEFEMKYQLASGREISSSYPCDLTEGLSTGELAKSLRRLFESHRINISPQAIVETIHPGQQWRLRGTHGSTEVEYQLTLNDNLVKCEITPQQDTAKEADVVWTYDMMSRLGVSQHNMATCSPLVYGDLLFVCTSNGVDETHLNLPAPNAPSFIALNKDTGEIVWTDNSPGTNILHGQWACPAIGVFDGVPQVIFPAGDGWIYSFHASEWKDGKPILLWKFDGNPKDAKWIMGGSGSRNNAIAPPVIYDKKVFIVMGQDPEHGGEGPGYLWCIDPTKHGDISSELAVDAEGELLPQRRTQAVDRTQGERAIPNPNSGVVWSFEARDLNQDGEINFEETLQRSIASPVIKEGLLYLADLAGTVHCIDVDTGHQLWNHDAFSTLWAPPLIADGKVFVGDEDGDLMIFRHSKNKELLNEIYLGDTIKMTPVAIGNTLYIGTRTTLYALSTEQ